MSEQPREPMPSPIDDPRGAAAFAPLWARFVEGCRAVPRFVTALERLSDWWGEPLAGDLRVWLAGTGDGIRPLIRVPADADSFAWLASSRERLDYELYLGGLLAVTGPDVQDTTFYAVIEPPRPTTRVARWDLGFDFGGTVAIDLPSFWVVSGACEREFPPDDDDALRQIAAELPVVSARIVSTFPWTRWFDEIADRLGDDHPAFGTCDVRSSFPAADAALVRAKPIIATLLDGRPFAGPPVDHAQLDAALDEPGFADSPPRALYWMWLAALNGDRIALARVREAVAGSAAKIVRDALAHALARCDG